MYVYSHVVIFCFVLVTSCSSVTFLFESATAWRKPIDWCWLHLVRIFTQCSTVSIHRSTRQKNIWFFYKTSIVFVYRKHINTRRWHGWKITIRSWTARRGPRRPAVASRVFVYRPSAYNRRKRSGNKTMEIIIILNTLFTKLIYTY